MYVTNTLPQCSPASVGLAQACPNYSVRKITIHSIRGIAWRNVHISYVNYIDFLYYTSTPVPTLAVLPKPSWVTTKMPKTTGVRDSRDYTALNPDIENDESTKTGTEDSGFEEWKQHAHQPCAPSPKGTHTTCDNIHLSWRDRASIINFTLTILFQILKYITTRV